LPVSGIALAPADDSSAGTTVTALPAPASAGDQADLPPGTAVGEYVIERRLGAGGMGEVYGAIHPLIHKRVAIKVLRRHLGSNRAIVQRFIAEARAVNRIGHPNIIDVFSFGTLPDGRHYSVMEWLPGETLSARLARERPPLGETLAILDQVCRALEAAHAQGIVHRDLKPDNVFLAEVRGERPRTKLLDFGIAKLMVDEDSVSTREGQLLGTPGYTSPEQARGKGVGPETDLYALGVMAYEMVVGRRPFQGTPGELLAQHLADAPPRPRALRPEISARLERLLLSLMAKDPGARGTLAETRATLAQLAAEAGGERPPRRARGLAAVVVAALLIAAGAGGWLASSRSRRAAAPPPVVPPAPSASAPRSPVPPPAPPAPPVVAPASAAASSNLILSSEREADLYVDGKLIGRRTTQAAAVVLPGPHVVEARMPGRRPLRQRVTSAEGQTVRLLLAGHVPAARAPTPEKPAPASAPRPEPEKSPTPAPAPRPDRMIDPFRRLTP
jgi:serine/threonine-protein kinase